MGNGEHSVVLGYYGRDRISGRSEEINIFLAVTKMNADIKVLLRSKIRLCEEKIEKAECSLRICGEFESNGLRAQVEWYRRELKIYKELMTAVDEYAAVWYKLAAMPGIKMGGLSDLIVRCAGKGLEEIREEVLKDYQLSFLSDAVAGALYVTVGGEKND